MAGRGGAGNIEATNRKISTVRIRGRRPHHSTFLIALLGSRSLPGSR